ncbi:response regulator [Marinospirillum sp.]|uniref:response regulator n=1 Tax=Marinospirillum sp. TaxID=2183934 RepID=UPI0028704D65|nr:response regulator [Marinospirillum sp.]MDR9468491.1 response regulator [Marinospirillum sp.]
MSDNQPQLLVIDDDQEIRELLGRYLGNQGIQCHLAASAAKARAYLTNHRPDLILLDIMMPGEDGLSLCRYLSEHQPDLPVIMVSAKNETLDRVLGLEIGADDYISKPFEPRELLARIKAVLRRSHAAPSTSATRLPATPVLEFAQWKLNTEARTLVDPEGVEITLSAAEFKLLQVFLQHPKRVLSRDQLLDLTAGREAQAFDRAIDNQVSRLRRKIEPDSRNPSLIKTVWGGGYQFNAEVKSLFSDN